jgi:hypothetical protein
MSKKKPIQTPIDKAFLGSDKHTLDDLKLQPWTQDREWAAGLMGMAYPNLGKEGLERLTKTNVYDEAVKDTCIWLYLSTLTPDEVEDAERFPDEAYKRARAFGMKRGVNQRDSKAFWDAYNKFWDVMKERREAVTKPKMRPVGGSDDEDDDPKA